MVETKQLIFGLLSTIDNPLLPFFIEGIASQGLKNIVVILDSKVRTKVQNKIWHDRTGGNFNGGEGHKINIYNLSSLRIPFFFVENHNDQNCLDLISNNKIDCLLNAGTPRKISKKILDCVLHGVVNIHPGVLPQYRGCTAVEWAILNDDKVGNTAHFMDEGYDTGNLILSECYEFPEDASYESIRIKVYKAGCLFAGKALKRINDKKMTPKDGLVQLNDDAKYRKPIPDEDFRVMLKKIESGMYLYQKH